jgi:hypothetical protein
MYKGFQQYNITPVSGTRSSSGRSQSSRSSAASAAGYAAREWSTVDSMVAASSDTNVAAESSAAHFLSALTRDTHITAEARRGLEPQLVGSSAVATEQPAAAPMRESIPQCVPVTAKVPPPGWSFYYDSLTKGAGARPEAAAGADTYWRMDDAEGW